MSSPAAPATAAAATHGVALGHQHRFVLCRVFTRVGERLEGAAAGVGEREAEKVVGQPGVLGQHRAVQVGRHDVAGVDAFAAVAAVVAEAQAHVPERSRRPQEGATAVVFEAHEQTVEVGDVGHDVAYEAPLAGLGGQGLEVDQSQAGQLTAVGGHVAAAQELQAGAHGEHDAAVVDHAGQPGAQPGEVGRGGVLHAVLAAAHEDQVAARRRLVAELDRVPAHGQAAQRGAPREGRHVAAVTVGVHGGREQVHGLDHCCTTPQPASAPRTSLSAV